MKLWVKGGIIGFIIFFVGLWSFLLIGGHTDEGWKCTTLEEPKYCSFSEFIFSGIHWGFVIFFSILGLIGGAIDTNIFQKIIYSDTNKKKKPLQITSVIVLTLVIIIGIIGILAFENWVTNMVYVIIFGIFVMFISWFIGRMKYGG